MNPRQVATGFFSAVSFGLLFSFGGAIYAAVLTVPGLTYLAVRSTSTTFRICAAGIVSLTVAECVWALTYVTLGEHTSAIWLVPTIATLFTCMLLAFTFKRTRSTT